MIKLLLEPVNLLILDEPTNHLDLPSKDVLKEAIKAFDGTAIIVSHDREFLDGLVDKVYEFGGGKVIEHLGGIYDYLHAHNAETIHEAITNATVQFDASSKTVESPANKMSYAEHKEQQKKQKKAEKKVKDCETRIATMEKRIKELDTLLMNPKNSTNMKFVTEYKSIKDSLDKENEEWFILSDALSELQK
jgi:ATP-binding cassette subfamily F protein 3